MIEIKEIKFEGFKALTIENKKISLTTIPELGGKIISIVNKDTGFDFIWRNKVIKLQKFSYGSPYALSDSSGIDELFPNIGGGKYIDFPWENIDIPDHGEIWSQSFKTTVEEDKIIQIVCGVRFPYIFNREISIDDNVIKLSYRVENLNQFKFNFTWAIHPIFKLLEDTEIIVEGSPDVTVDYNSTNKELISRDKKYIWPVIEAEDGEKMDFSKVAKNKGEAFKLVLSNLSTGLVTLKYGDKNEKIDVIFNKNENKYCGLWLNSKGWPAGNECKYNHVSIAPGNAIMGSLEECIHRNGFGSIESEGQVTWDIKFNIS